MEKTPANEAKKMTEPGAASSVAATLARIDIERRELKRKYDERLKRLDAWERRLLGLK
jgi:hypothetical protein